MPLWATKILLFWKNERKLNLSAVFKMSKSRKCKGKEDWNGWHMACHLVIGGAVRIEAATSWWWRRNEEGQGPEWQVNKRKDQENSRGGRNKSGKSTAGFQKTTDALFVQDHNLQRGRSRLPAQVAAAAVRSAHARTSSAAAVQQQCQSFLGNPAGGRQARGESCLPPTSRSLPRQHAALKSEVLPPSSPPHGAKSVHHVCSHNIQPVTGWFPLEGTARHKSNHLQLQHAVNWLMELHPPVWLG